MKTGEPGLTYAENIVDTLREALIVLDEDLRVLSANRSFYHQFRVTPGETIGRLIYELGNRDWDIPDLRHLLEAVIPKHTTIEGYEVRHRFARIGEKVMLLNARRMEKEESSSGFILIAIEDITIRYITRIKLAESEAKYRRFVEEINSIIIGFDRNGSITFFNHFSEKLFGYNRDEIIGKPFVGTIIPITDSNGKDNSGLCSEVLKEPHRFYASESEGLCKDGRRVVFSWSAKAMKDTSGSTAEILIDGNDITGKKDAEESIRESERNLGEAQRISHVGSWMWNVETDEIQCSAETFRIYGEEPFSFRVTSGTFLEYVHPEDRESLTGLLADIRAGLTDRLNIEFRIVRKNGMIRYIHSIGEVSVVSAEGKPKSIRGTGQDITERKLLEKDLEDERDFVTAVIQTSGALITVIDLDGNITRFNKAAEELTGYTEDEVLGESVFDLFVPPEERDAVEGIAERLFAGERRVDYENHWITRSGEKHFIRWRNSALLDENSKPAGAVATGIDITVRQQAMEALQKSEEQFRTERNLLQQIVNNLPYSFILYDRDLRIEYTNRTVLERYGLRLDQVQGKTIPEIFSKEISDIFVPLIKHVRETGKPFSGEVSYHRGGELLTNIPNIVPLYNGRNEITHILILSIDITERKRMENALLEDITKRKQVENALHLRTEDLEIANRDLESFSYSVSHDLRSPLTIIQGFSNILLEEYDQKLGEHGIGILRQINAATDKMSSIINNLLSLARISRERMNCQEIDLSPIADSVMNELRQTEPNRTVVTRIDNAMPAFADSRFMTITLTNLIGNAWKYTGKNPAAQIDIGLMDKEGENVFFIRDNGAGFDMKFAHKLFKPFERLHSENEFAGTGIGLAIVQRIIQRHGGKIWVESQKDRGSAFYFTLNCRQR